MHARALAYKEIIDLLDGAAQRVKDINARMETATKSYGF